MATLPMQGPAFAAYLAASVLISGLGAVGAALALTPSFGGPELSRGARIYTEECAGCHGASLQGRIAGPPGQRIPPLGVTGHAWQHSDAELFRLVARGSNPGAGSAMPAFDDRLAQAEIEAVLIYVKSHWPARFRYQQAALHPGGDGALVALLRDPDATLPGDCLPAVATTR
ncbi:c-type cytochrome [Paracraurococcus ruber]|nr:cytochrome c [Paracraurococcus ruber]